MGKYKCNKCGKVVERESTKKWMLSYCEYSGLKARLYSCPESTFIADHPVSFEEFTVQVNKLI